MVDTRGHGAAEVPPVAATEAADDPELAALEALADEIEAADAMQAGGEQGQPAGGGSRGGPSAPLVQDCWEMAFDRNSQQSYWFNRALGTSQWHPPPGWAGQQAPAPSAAAGQQQGGANPPAAWPQQQGEASGVPVAAAAAGEAGAAQPPNQHQHQQQQEWPQGCASYEPGYYYRDAFGQLQGPFTLDQLRQWRPVLPMDLPVLQLEEHTAASTADGSTDGSGAGAASKADASTGDGSRSDVQQGQQAEQSWRQLELAGLLGDEELLERWRLENPEQAAWPGTAQPATAYAAELQKGTAHSLAEAVLCGLPAHDEAVAVARMAAAVGKSVQEVADWQRNVDYTQAAHRVAARGRIQAAGGQESLYQEAASWVNPHDLEQQLARAAERRKRTLTGQELRQVKQRKQELKEKKRTAWLYT